MGLHDFNSLCLCCKFSFCFWSLCLSLLHACCDTRTSYLICLLCCFLSRISYLSLSSFSSETTVAFLPESYMLVKWTSYVFCIYFDRAHSKEKQTITGTTGWGYAARHPQLMDVWSMDVWSMTGFPYNQLVRWQKHHNHSKLPKDRLAKLLERHCNGYYLKLFINITGKWRS